MTEWLWAAAAALIMIGLVLARVVHLVRGLHQIHADGVQLGYLMAQFRLRIATGRMLELIDNQCQNKVTPTEADFDLAVGELKLAVDEANRHADRLPI